MDSIATTSSIRIYVGGLGESVGEDDLRKIFGSLGTIGAVDIVRTKGRSFAYLDFVPSAHNSLNKLFSTYNGCAWKGGRLRLEKAKEHYLVRLRREWAEDAELSAHSDAIDEDKDSAAPIKPEKSLDSEKHLQIFFPRLRKVKSLPFRGTGKHKYSFQRVEAPLLPKHFCDCEEHSDVLKILEVEKIQELDFECGGMDAKELDIMNSVMNKLFQRETGTIAVPSVNESVKEEEIYSTGFGKPQMEENKIDGAEDDDNLVINIVEGAGDGITGSYSSLSMSQKSRSNKRPSARDRQTGNMVKIEKSDGVSSAQKSKSLPHGHGVGKESFSSSSLPILSDTSGNIQEHWGAGSDSWTQHKQTQAHHPWSQKSSWKELVGDGNKSAFAVSCLFPGSISIEDVPLESNDLSVPKSFVSKNLNVDEHDSGVPATAESLKVERTTENQSAVQNESSAKTGRGSSWLHKSSWTQLVTNSKSKSFTISQIIPALNSEKHEFRDDNIADSKQSEPIQDDSSVLRGGGMENTETSTLTSQLVEQNSQGLTGSQEGPNSGSHSVEKSNEAAVSVAEESHISSPKQSAVGMDEEECLFMRSQASLRDWANSKAAITKSLKRKRRAAAREQSVY